MSSLLFPFVFFEIFLLRTNTVDCSDYYPKDLNNLDFISVMKPFHDKYSTSPTLLSSFLRFPHQELRRRCICLYTASATTKFAIGETGLGVTSTVAQRNQWLEMITSAKTKQAMPNFISVSWLYVFPFS